MEAKKKGRGMVSNGAPVGRRKKRALASEEVGGNLGLLGEGEKEGKVPEKGGFPLYGESGSYGGKKWHVSEVERMGK